MKTRALETSTHGCYFHSIASTGYNYDDGTILFCHVKCRHAPTAVCAVLPPDPSPILLGFIEGIHDEVHGRVDPLGPNVREVIVGTSP